MGIVQLALPRQNDEEKKANERGIWTKETKYKRIEKKTKTEETKIEEKVYERVKERNLIKSRKKL